MDALFSEVESNNEVLTIGRKGKSGVVVIQLQEYNSIMETLYLLGNKANAKRLWQSIDEIEGDRNQTREL